MQRAAAHTPALTRSITPWRSDVPTRPEYVRTPSRIAAELAELARLHPGRARLEDIGDSARKVAGSQAGHDLQALVLGEHADDPTVPRIIFTAGVHPRETANPAVLVEWATRTLTAAANGDPARVALLRDRTVVLVPVVNPDSLDTVIDGLDAGNMARIWRRTNHGARGGVDLNRNFDNRWGAGSSTPSNQRYRGPHAASEPEVQAIQQLGERLQPAAVYDLHSPGGVVLAPTGAPDARAAAQLVSRASGYPVSSSNEHWREPVGGGTVKDWSHDRLGAVSLTIETGSVHHQDRAQYADTLARMLPSLDALVATVDGRHQAPVGAEALARPAAARPFVMDEHMGDAVMTTEPYPARPGDTD